MTGMDPRTYYDEYGQREWERLDANPVTRLEFEGTIEYLQRDLPAEGSVLDAGGGPGGTPCGSPSGATKWSTSI